MHIGLKIFLAIIITIGTLLALTIVNEILGIIAIPVNGDFADKVYIRQDWNDGYIEPGKEKPEVEVTDPNDIRELKRICRGRLTLWSDACVAAHGGDNNYVKFVGKGKTILFHPSGDGCPTFRINRKDNFIHITREDRTKLEEIVKKYGMNLPWV